nr:hypothetical protein [Jiella pelagia]
MGIVIVEGMADRAVRQRRGAWIDPATADQRRLAVAGFLQRHRPCGARDGLAPPREPDTRPIEQGQFGEAARRLAGRLRRQGKAGEVPGDRHQ